MNLLSIEDNSADERKVHCFVAEKSRDVLYLLRHIIMQNVAHDDVHCHFRISGTFVDIMRFLLCLNVLPTCFPSTSNCLIVQVTSKPRKLWHWTLCGCLYPYRPIFHWLLY